MGKEDPCGVSQGISEYKFTKYWDMNIKIAEFCGDQASFGVLKLKFKWNLSELQQLYSYNSH